MKTQKPTFKFISIIVISAVIGGFLGWSLMHFEKATYQSLIYLQSFILKNNFLIQSIILGLCALFILITYFSTKQKLKHLDENDDALFDQIDRQLGFLLPFISVTMIIGFSLFGITVTNALNESTLIGLMLFIINTAFTVVMNVLSIKLTKVLYPEKKGNPLDSNFNKDWIKSCDEAEKYVIYKASYRCCQLMNFVYCGIITFCLLVSIIVNIGIFPYLLIGFLWITQTLVYSISANRFQHGQLDNVQ